MSVEQARMAQLVREVYGDRRLTQPRPRRTNERPRHPCTRCGILTRYPDRCRDCQEVDP